MCWFRFATSELCKLSFLTHLTQGESQCLGPFPSLRKSFFARCFSHKKTRQGQLLPLPHLPLFALVFLLLDAIVPHKPFKTRRIEITVQIIATSGTRRPFMRVRKRN